MYIYFFSPLEASFSLKEIEQPNLIIESMI